MDICHFEIAGNATAKAYELVEKIGAINVDRSEISGRIQVHFKPEYFFAIPGITYEISFRKHNNICPFKATSEFETFDAFCLLTEAHYWAYVAGRTEAL